MIIGGKRLADNILKNLSLAWAKIKMAATLGIISVGQNPASASFIKEKIKAAEMVGIHYRIYQFPASVSVRRLKKSIQRLLKNHPAWIVQLPLPEHINTQEVLDTIPLDKDADVLSTHSWFHFLMGGKILPPSVAALKEVFRRHKIKVKNRATVVVGFGRLVGQPVAFWLSQQKAKVMVVNEGDKNSGTILRKADIIISGVGKPALIKGKDVKKGAIVIDFGFAKTKGKISGDVDFKSVVKKAKLLTPVPGGMGPLVVAMLIKNVLQLATVYHAYK